MTDDDFDVVVDYISNGEFYLWAAQTGHELNCLSNCSLCHFEENCCIGGVGFHELNARIKKELPEEYI